MTTRIINGVKFDYEVSEMTERELLAIAGQDESLNMEDFENPTIKIAVGDVFDEFLGFEVFDLSNVNDAVVDYLEIISETDNDETNIMYVVGGESNQFVYFEAPDVLKTLKVDRSIMDERENELKKLIGQSWTDTSELENDLICAIGEVDELENDVYAKITPEVGADLYVEDEPRHSYYDIDLDYNDGEMTITDVYHVIRF